MRALRDAHETSVLAAHNPRDLGVVVALLPGCAGSAPTTTPRSPGIVVPNRDSSPRSVPEPATAWGPGIRPDRDVDHHRRRLEGSRSQGRECGVDHHPDAVADRSLV